MKKELIKVTPAAIERIQNLIAKRSKPTAGIRIGVKSGGCSGVKYKFEYADSINVTEEVVEVNGVKIIIEPTAIMYLVGTTLGYFDESSTSGKSGFTFDNPNAKNSCGCGESFNT